MTLHAYLLFLPVCFALNLAFGPNNLLSVTYGARHGVGTAMKAGLGRLAAFVIMITISGLGIGTLLMASALAFTVVKFAGAAYLIWLGIKLLRAPAAASMVALRHIATQAPRPSTRQLMRQEFVVAIGNPKAILIFTAFLPQFVVPGAYVLSYLEIAVTFLILEWFTLGIYAELGCRMVQFTRGSGSLRWFNRASGTMMIFFGLLLAVARRPQT